MKNYSAVFFIRLISKFFQEMMAINRSPSLCIVQEKIYKKREEMMYIKFDLLGLNLNLNLKASDIVKNRNLFVRFSYEDKSDIVFYSGLCTYRISDLTLDDSQNWIITLEASFDNTRFFKKFKLDEFFLGAPIKGKLSSKEINLIDKLMHDKKVISLPAIMNTNSICINSSLQT